MVIFLVLLAVASRLLPHPLNFAPIGALGLFAGAYLSRRGGWLLPLAALLLSDAIHGFYSPLLMAFVYSGFAVSGLIGRIFLSENRTPWRLLFCALAGSTAFFLISNLGIWVVGSSMGNAWYPHTGAGLMRCYVMGLPYFRNTVAGDLFYTATLFGLLELARYLARQRQQAQAI